MVKQGEKTVTKIEGKPKLKVKVEPNANKNIPAKSGSTSTKSKTTTKPKRAASRPMTKAKSPVESGAKSAKKSAVKAINKSKALKVVKKDASSKVKSTPKTATSSKAKTKTTTSAKVVAKSKITTSEDSTKTAKSMVGFDEFYFSSVWQNTKVYAWTLKPKGKPRAIIQIVHGMVENSASYIDLAKTLAKQGFIVVAHDMLGHGKTIGKDKIKGYFGDKNGWLNLIQDSRELTAIAKEKFPNLPFFLYGHSMGSLIARQYCALYAKNLKLDGVILGSTVATGKALSRLGVTLSYTESKILGKMSESKIADRLFYGMCDQLFHKIIKAKPHEKYHSDEWLTRDENQLKIYDKFRYLMFTFTTSGYVDLLKLSTMVTSKKWAEKVPCELPILIMSGTADPIGNYGKGILKIVQWLKDTKHKKVTLKLYKDARHVLLREKNADEVLKDLIDWLNQIIS